MRGSHSGSFRYDPLGRDRPPPGWPHERPTKDEIVAALTARANETVALSNGSPRLGDPGFLAFLHERCRAGMLTRSEWLGRVELHGALWRARPADEEAVLAEVEELVAEGVLVLRSGDATSSTPEARA